MKFLEVLSQKLKFNLLGLVSDLIGNGNLHVPLLAKRGVKR